MGSSASLKSIDPTTGTAKFTIGLEQGTNKETDGCGPNGDLNEVFPPQTGNLMIAGDGYAGGAYVPPFGMYAGFYGSKITGRAGRDIITD